MLHILDEAFGEFYSTLLGIVQTILMLGNAALLVTVKRRSLDALTLWVIFLSWP
jgi:hypothetical protein